MSATRRQWLAAISVGGAGLILSGCANGNKAQSGEQPGGKSSAGDEDRKGGEVTATEDLMREHGILRRALLVYQGVVPKLRSHPPSVAPDALQRTAKLFRAFGEDYHEKKLEEAYIFPAVKQAGGAAAALPDVLTAQYQRGREITDYIIAVTNGGKLGAGNADALAKALESFVLMYGNHAAREDTIIFPAWKQTLTAKQLDEMGEKFEEIEEQQFGGDGYEDAVRQIGDIEGSLGLADISQFTAPPPPKVAGS